MVSCRLLFKHYHRLECCFNWRLMKVWDMMNGRWYQNDDTLLDFFKGLFFLQLDTKRRQSSVDMIEDKRFFTCHLSAVLSLQRGRCQADVFLLLAYQKRFTTREDDNAVTCSDLQQEWRTAWGSDRDSCTEGASIGCHKRWVTVGRLKEKKLPVT